jgi:8-hydroxy-5-deazaflavin:NADPH oxidoreductase
MLRPRAGLFALFAAAVFAWFGISTTACAQSDSIRIGIIGTGNVGGALARLWVNAGHEVLMSSRNPDQLVDLAEELGPLASVGTPREAAAFGDVVLVSVPYAATPQIGSDYADELAGKIVLDTGNPIERRDGAMAVEALRKGSGIASAEFLHGTRLVRAFNCIPAASLRNDAHRTPEPIAIPLAGDDEAALEVARRLVRDAGFDPVVVGPLEQARLFELGQPLARGQFTAAEMRAALAEIDAN